MVTFPEMRKTGVCIRPGVEVKRVTELSFGGL